MEGKGNRLGGYCKSTGMKYLLLKEDRKKLPTPAKVDFGN